VSRRAIRDGGTRVLGWGALPPPVHGSSIMNVVARDAIERAGVSHWVNAATGESDDMAELGSVSTRKLLATLGRMADFAFHATWWERRHTAYLSISTTPPALYRDLVIWSIAAVTSPRIVIHVHTGDLSGLRPDGLLAPLRRRLIRRSEFWVLGSVLVGQLQAFGATKVRVVANGVTCQSSHHHEGRTAQPPPAAVAERAAEGGALIGAGGGELTDAGGSERSVRADEGDVRVVFLSHHFRSKGVDVVAELAELLEDESFAWTFAGSVVEPDTEAMLRPLARLGPRYRRIETVDADVRCRLLHESDVFLLPSSYPHEASPLVVIEAMEHGVIPIVSSRGCMPEVVGRQDAVCDSTDEYAEALRLLAKERGELMRRSAEVTERWRESYSRESFERTIDTLLFRAAGEGRSGGRPDDEGRSCEGVPA
jgi:glycosyltransferase involved in cell wall biosynthesis